MTSRLGDDAQRPNLTLGLLLPRGIEPDTQRIIDLQNALPRQIVQRIQFERCKYWHQTAASGEFLRFLWWEMRPWVSAGFAIDRRFPDAGIVASYSSTSGRRAVPPSSSGIPGNYRDILGHLCGYWGHREFQRLSTAVPWMPGTRAEASLIAFLGGPPMLLLLCESLWRLLDMVYLAVHGDYACALATWLLNIESAIRTFNLPLPELLDETERTHSKKDQCRILAGLWQASAVPYFAKWSMLRRDVTRWLADKPKTGAEGPEWPQPAKSSDRGQSGFLVNESLHDYLAALKRITGGSITVDSQHRDIKIVMTGGAYRNGGRKPPSVSHGTTYGVDLDLVGTVPGEFDSPPARSKKGAEEWMRRSLREGAIAEKPPEGSQKPRAAVNTLFGLPQYDAAVMFTQAILLSLPSRLYYGDIVVISAAVGGLTEWISEEDMSLVLGVSYTFDPAIHFNHWHVDWLPPDMPEEPCANWALLYFGEQKSCEGRQAEVPPILRKYWKRQFVRPLYYGVDKTQPGSLEDIEQLITALGAQVPFMEPIGDVKNAQKVIAWIKKYGLPQTPEEKDADAKVHDMAH